MRQKSPSDLLLQASRFAFENLEICDPVCAQELRLADKDAMSIHPTNNTAARSRLEIGNVRRLHAAVLCSVHDCDSKRMFAILLDCCCRCQQFLLGYRIGDNNTRYARFAFRQCAGLVEDERSNFFHQLDGFRFFDQHACLCSATNTDHD